MGRMADQRSPQAFAGIRANTREPAQFARKKPKPRTVGVGVLVEIRGDEHKYARLLTGEKSCGFVRSNAHTLIY